MNIVLVRTPKGIRYAEMICHFISSRGISCYVSDVDSLRSALRENNLTPQNTLIHFRTAGPEVNEFNAELAREGFRVINSARTLHLTSNKYASQIHAKKNGIPVAETVLVRKKDTAVFKNLLARFGSIVLKPVWSQGQGIYCHKIDQGIADAQLMETIYFVPGDAIQAQEYIPYKKLIRVVVIGYRALIEATTYDEPNESWKCSVCMNPNIKKYGSADARLFELAEKTARAFEANINYIDFFETAAGDFILNEINTACSLRLHEQVTGCRIHEHIGNYLIRLTREQ